MTKDEDILTMSKNKEALQKAVKKLAVYLSHRSHSEKELKVKLSKNFPESIVLQALETAKANHWLETEEELSQKLLRVLDDKNKSWSYIKSYFFKKALPLPAYDREKERDKAKALLFHKFGDLKSLSFKQKMKCRQFLSYRGFEEGLLEELLEERE